MLIKNWLTTFCAAVAVVAACASLVNAEYYSGKYLTVISPVPAGSGLDRLTRSFARHWGKHIPGQPQLVIKNMPGAGGAQALNYLYEKAKPDGHTVAWGPWNGAGIITGSPGLRYVPEKFELIGSGHAYGMSLMRTDVAPGIKQPTDVMKAKSFNVGGRRADRNLDLLGNLTLEMIGAKYRFVGGYRGMAKINPALRANEVQAAHSGHIGYNIFFKDTLIKSGDILVLWYFPTFDIKGNPQKIAGFSELQPFHEVYQKVHGKKPSGPLWEAFKWYSSVVGTTSMTVFAPPGTPKERVAELRKGHLATTKDKAYLESETKRLGMPLGFNTVEQGLHVLKTYRDVSPQVLEALKQMANVGQR